MRLTCVLIGLVASLALSSCGSSSEEPQSRTSTKVACGNPDGGQCLNALRPGTSYRTARFRPTIRYSVPRTGWSNEEDLAGNFLLVPPGNDLSGVNAGTSDFIGVYTSITASRFTDLDGCLTAPRSRVPRTPSGFVAWLQRQPVLSVSPPKPFEQSGLEGLTTDVRIAPGQTPPTCSDGSDTFAVALLFSGVGPSSLDHGVIAGMTMRLDLMQRGEQLMVIEIDDIDAAPGDLDTLSAQARRLHFES